MRLLIAFVLLLTLVAPVAAKRSAPPAAQERPYMLEGTERHFGSLQQAVNAIGEGSGTIIVADGTWRDCAVQIAGRVTYRAANAGLAVLEGQCEDKAALVLRGAAARIEGLTLRGIADGAGIRLEKGDLDLSRVAFRDSRQGLVAADDAATIRIERATFSGLGHCAQSGACTAALDVGTVAMLDISRSRFERGRGGDYLRSRAARLSITGSSFDDTRGRTTRLMIDLPAGAIGRIRDNIFVQGPGKAQPGAFIALAREARSGAGSLEIAGNEARIAPGAPRKAVFLIASAQGRAALGANRLGPGVAPVEAR